MTRDEMLSYLRDVHTIREMENEAIALYQQKKIRGFLHLYVGQVSGGCGSSSPLVWLKYGRAQAHRNVAQS